MQKKTVLVYGEAKLSFSVKNIWEEVAAERNLLTDFFAAEGDALLKPLPMLICLF